MAVNKPAGLLVHRSMIDRYETRFAMQILRDQIGQYVFPVHRLDKPTSGVLLFALNSDTARKMGELFSTGLVEKEYLAVVRGYTNAHGIIDYPLKEELDKKSDMQARQNKQPQDAVTEYQRRSEEHTSELQSLRHLVCRLLLEKKKTAKSVREATGDPRIHTI